MTSPAGKITAFPCQVCGTHLVMTPTARLYCPRCEQLRIMGAAMQQFHSGLNSGQLAPPEQRKEYRVTWCIDIDADSPEEAVRAVWQRYFHHGHTATVFEVQEFNAPASESIDVGPDDAE